jgi:carbohydrate-binding DOMON domain-containing protein
MTRYIRRSLLALAAGLVTAASAHAGDVSFKDPVGDDKGPGTYVYPTDAVYTPGSFDLIELKVTDGGNVGFNVTVNDALRDPWGMDVGFAVQMVFVYIDNKPGGHKAGLAGQNVVFAEDSAWDKVVILSPQPASRVQAEIRTKGGDMSADIVVPRRTTGAGRTIGGKVKKEELGDGDPATWGYQVVMQSNEGFPDKADLLTRKVNEFEGQHRFGGGSDADCDPHVMDVLAGKGAGDASEAQAQYDMLAYECGPEGEPAKRATLTMVRR